MKKRAKLSRDRNFRYLLWRIWDEEKPVVGFVMLNPSTADEQSDDPTIEKCIGYARRWGYGGILVANLFAKRSPDPETLREIKKPVGPDNDKYIQYVCFHCEIVVCAWGNNGDYLGRSNEVLKIIDEPYCLRLNKTGHPAHPLYLPVDLDPVRFDYEAAHNLYN